MDGEKSDHEPQRAGADGRVCSGTRGWLDQRTIDTAITDLPARLHSMPTPPDSNDLSSWHKYFGAASNDEAWTLAEKATLWPEEIEALLNHAHSAALHWRAVGTPVNQNRARLLLALAHCRAGHVATAKRFATSVRAFNAVHDTPHWEQALSAAISAYAAAISGDAEAHASHYAHAAALIAALPEPEERAIVSATLAVVPKQLQM